MTVGVVIPCRNGERYLAEAIGSIRGQTVPPDDVVLADDHSSDTSAAVAVGAGARVVAADREGASAARNAGVAAVRGDIVAFLDADDVATPDRLERQLACLADPAVEAVVGGVRNFISPDRAAELHGRVAFRAGDDVGYAFSALTIRRTALERLGGFDEALGHADTLEFFTRARAELTFAVVDAVVCLRRVHGDNHTLRSAQALRADYLRAARAAILRRREQA